MRHVDLTSLKRFIGFGPPGGANTAEPSMLDFALAQTPLRRMLARVPQPLIDPDRKLIVIYSAKSACTNLLLWFLHHLGHLQAARDFHWWPHRYRDHVYYRSDIYQRGLRSRLREFTVVRVVRDPFQRALSSFRHVVRHKSFDEHIGRVLSQPAEAGLSLSRFLDFLEKIDLADCDPHYALQHHPIEKILPVHHLINVSVENLFARFNEIEAAVGLPKSDLAHAEWVQELSERHQTAKHSFSGDAYTRILTRQDALKRRWPDYDVLLTDEAKARIAKLYATDLKAYGIES
jgi:hypothetical protein